MTASSTSEARFRRAFDAHYESIARYCLRRIAAGDVNDVVADVFTIAWRKVDDMPDGDRALPWLYGVARNEIRNRFRADRRRLDLIEFVARQPRKVDPGPETVVVRSAEFQRLLDALATLRSADREVLLLRTHEELTFAQIGTVLDLGPEAVRKRFTRAIARLRSAAGIPDPQSAASGSRAIKEGGDG